MTDCYDWKTIGGKTIDGIYLINPPGTEPFQVWCDMTTDGGGWTVFQRRVDNTTSFYDKTWSEYKNGFNNSLNINLWLGNDRIHILSTKDSKVNLRIDIWGDRAPNSKCPNGYWFRKYESFSIDNEANFYTFHVSSSLTSNGGDSESPDGISENNGTKFYTMECHHEKLDNAICTWTSQFGGWWTYNCGFLSLNGKYVPSKWGSNEGFTWYSTDCSVINPKLSHMMLRRMVS